MIEMPNICLVGDKTDKRLIKPHLSNYSKILVGDQFKIRLDLMVKANIFTFLDK